MLKINFELESENDLITPATIAHALVESPDIAGVTELEDIANHLMVHVRRCYQRQDEVRENIEQFRKDLSLD